MIAGKREAMMIFIESTPYACFWFHISICILSSHTPSLKSDIKCF